MSLLSFTSAALVRNRRFISQRRSVTELAVRGLVCAVAISCGPAVGRAATRVDLTLAVAGDAPVAVQQRWYQLLTESKGISVRLRKRQSSDAPSQQTTGSGESRVVRVVGVVDARGILSAPGGRFSPSDRDRVRQWLADLQAEPMAPPAESAAERASKENLSRLSQPVTFSTKGRSRAEVLQQLRRETALPLEFDVGAEASLAPHRDETNGETSESKTNALADEFQGIALGTALAALLRPAELGLRARRNGEGAAVFLITASGSPRDHWPIGQPVPEGAKNVLPELFEFFSADLDDVPLDRVIVSVAGRLHAPVLWDWRAMRVAGVDPAAVRVSFAPRKTAYLMLLREVLRRAELRFELRTDDADKPFLWITTKMPLEMLEAARVGKP